MALVDLTLQWTLPKLVVQSVLELIPNQSWIGLVYVELVEVEPKKVPPSPSL
jgi:hypothetical protein